MKTADGKFVSLGASDREGTVEAIPAAASGKETWRTSKSEIAFSFEKKGDAYLLSDFHSTDKPH